MTRPNDENGQDASNWWNEQGKNELEELEFLQKEMMRAMKKPLDDSDEEEEDMGPPDLPEDDEDMGPPDLPEDDDEEMVSDDLPEDDEEALEPTDREMDMQDRMNGRRDRAMRRPRMRNRAERMMKSGAPRDAMSKALRAEMELKRAFSPEKRRDLAKNGMALPDGSFPIVTEEDLKNAIAAFGRAKSKAAAKRHIMKRARALKRSDLIPDKWDKKDAKGDGVMCKKTGKMVPAGSPVCPECKGDCTAMAMKGEAFMCKASGKMVTEACAECKGGCDPMGYKGMYGADIEMPRKKKKLRYGEKEADMAEMEDNEMTSPMSREELMDRVFKKKKKKPMPEESMDDESMPEEDEETE